MADLVQYANGSPTIRFKVDKPIIRIGRCADDNDICLLDNFTSKQHAIIEVKANHNGDCEFFLRDLGSTNHTYVNKKKVSRLQLHNNDLVYIGQQMFRFVCDEHEEIEGVDKPDDHTQEIDESHSDSKSSFSRRLNILR
ncbi:MAG: FHA domain-containing protein [Halobacteria archaeon]|nr:FHA domain-containing protein [Halobacteria archaeon]